MARKFHSSLWLLLLKVGGEKRHKYKPLAIYVKGMCVYVFLRLLMLRWSSLRRGCIDKNTISRVHVSLALLFVRGFKIIALLITCFYCNNTFQDKRVKDMKDERKNLSHKKKNQNQSKSDGKECLSQSKCLLFFMLFHLCVSSLFL